MHTKDSCTRHMHGRCIRLQLLYFEKTALVSSVRSRLQRQDSIGRLTSPGRTLQDKLTPSEELGDLMRRAGDNEAALGIYQKANVPQKVIEGLAAKGDFEALSKFRYAAPESVRGACRFACFLKKAIWHEARQSGGSYYAICCSLR